MTLKPGNKPVGGLPMAVVLTGLLLIFSQKNLIVPAEEPHSVEISETDLAEDVSQDGLPEVEMRLAGRTFRLEVASTPEQAQKGLMYRTHLPDGHGMLFPFEPPRAVNFWMKNTKIPLDMIFLRQGTVLRVIRDVPPCQSDPCPTYSSVYPVDMVLEVPAGTARKAAIDSGMTAVIRQAAPADETTATVPTAVPATKDP